MKLCEFLLRKYSYFREDAVMRSALEWYLRSSNFWYNEHDPLQTDALYHLLVKQYGLSVDLDDQTASYSPISLNESIMDNRLLTASSLEDILASQALPFKQWSYSNRFFTCMRSKGWLAEAFWEAIQCEDTTTIITKTDSEGRTALHWAAENLGYWLGPKVLREETDPDTTKRRHGYGALVSKLIRLGADAHAVDFRHRTPLLACLQAMMGKFETKVVGIAELETIGRKWGRLLSNGGLSLSLYAANENRLTEPLDQDQRTLAQQGGVVDYVFERVEVLGDAELVLHITIYTSISVWRFHPMPGSWEQPCHDKLISTTADFFHEHEGSWEQIHVHKFQSGSVPVNVHDRSQQQSLSFSSLHDTWKEYFLSAQDDHGPLFTIASRDSALSKDFDSVPRRRRTKSFTPSVTPWILSSPFQKEVSPNVRLGKGHWLHHVHKCSLTSKWTAMYWPEHGEILTEDRCFIEGLQEEFLRVAKWIFRNHWEAEYIKSCIDDEKVCQFVERACPEGRELLTQRLFVQQRGKNDVTMGEIR
jgi:hypothetical protein